VDAAAKFIQNEFMERNLNKSKMIYPHFTTATDTSNIKVRGFMRVKVVASCVCLYG